jgi:small subunit ribosomal protein S16
MVKIRLKRFGAKKKPFYRIVVADSRVARDGKAIEEIGYYNPLTTPATISLDAVKVNEWLDKGAQPTDTVRDILKREGILEQRHARSAK